MAGFTKKRNLELLMKTESNQAESILEIDVLAAPNLIYGNKKPKQGRKYAFQCESFDGRIARFKLREI